MYESVALNILVYIVVNPPSISRTLSSCKTGTLYSLNDNSPFLSSSTPGGHHSIFCFYEFDHFHIPYRSGIIHYLSFYLWFISLNIMSSKFTHVVACQNFVPF